MLKWELDLWGRIRRSIEAAQAQLLSRGENQRTVVLELVSAVAQAYFDLRQLDFKWTSANGRSHHGTKLYRFQKSSCSTG